MKALGIYGALCRSFALVFIAAHLTFGVEIPYTICVLFAIPLTLEAVMGVIELFDHD